MATHHFLHADIVGEQFRDDVRIRQKDIADGLEGGEAVLTHWFPFYLYKIVVSHLSKSLHVVPHDLWIGTLELPDNLKALVKLGEHIHDGTGEQGMF